MEAGIMANRIIFISLLFSCLVFPQTYKNIDVDEIKFDGKIIINFSTGKSGDSVKIFYYGGSDTIQWSVGKYGDQYNKGTLEVGNWLKIKSLTLNSYSDSLLVIDKATDDTVATRKWARENIGAGSSADTSSLVTKASTQVISGIKYFTNTRYFDGNNTIVNDAIIFDTEGVLQLPGAPSPDPETWTNPIWSVNNLVLYSQGNTGVVDTLATRNYVWSSYTALDSGSFVTKSSTQVINGNKYITGIMTVPSGGGITYSGTGYIKATQLKDIQLSSLTTSKLVYIDEVSGQSFASTSYNYDQVATFAGSVSSTEYGYLANVTSDIQTQLNSKGTSNFDGAYSSLTGKPTLGTMAAKNIGISGSYHVLTFGGGDIVLGFTDGILTTD
jgi:hypothetical protein